MSFGKRSVQHPWLFSMGMDLGFLIAPVVFCWVILLQLPQGVLHVDIPLWVWVMVVLGIDVGHVWTTIFRSYARADEFAAHRTAFTVAPIVIFLLIFAVAYWSIDWFWRCMAYFAVFHFVKQQYGFTKLYSRGESTRTRILSDKRIVNLATVYPVINWHFQADKQIHWFVEGDFLSFGEGLASVSWVMSTCNIVYWMLIAAWVAQELWIGIKYADNISWGKILWVLTTAGNWFFGIIYFNSDLIFSVTNIVAHGVPYYFLIYWYGLQKQRFSIKGSIARFWNVKWLTMLVGIALLLAFIEEYCWDMLVYRDRVGFFEAVLPYGYEVATGRFPAALALGLLALPQLLHYYIDGIIWKGNHRNSHLKHMFNSNAN